MTLKNIRAGLAALLAVAAVPAQADYVGVQAGGGTITYGAFAPTLGGVVTQLTKSVTVDPTTGQAIFTTAQPGYVSVVGTPALATGAATSALQTSGNTSLSSIDGKTPTLASGRVPVDGSGVTQPVSLASQPLPSGAATAALQTTGNTSLATIATNTPTLSSGRVPVDGSAVTQPVSATALPLPVGASTSALQTSGNTSLATIATNTPTVGQKTSALSSPVVLPSDQTVNVAVTSGGINAGTAGTPGTDVLTIQGVTNGTAIATAATPNRSSAVDAAATVTTTAAQVLAASPSRAFLAIINQSSTAGISCRFGAVPVAGAAGSIDIPAGATRTWTASYVPTAVLQCIAASGSVPVTIQSN